MTGLSILWCCPSINFLVFLCNDHHLLFRVVWFLAAYRDGRHDRTMIICAAWRLRIKFLHSSNRAVLSGRGFHSFAHHSVCLWYEKKETPLIVTGRPKVLLSLVCFTCCLGTDLVCAGCSTDRAQNDQILSACEFVAVVVSSVHSLTNLSALYLTQWFSAFNGIKAKQNQTSSSNIDWHIE